MSKFPEIQALQEIYQKYEITIHVSQDDFLTNTSNYPAIKFTINNDSFHLYINDEYEDLQYNNSLLSLCLALRELEMYHEGSDILSWCKSQQLEVNNSKVVDYYKSLSKIYVRIEEIIGTIDSQISDLDFQLNAGAIQELRGNS